MINLFLKAKHWQLFLLTFGLPIIFHIIMMSSIITKMTSQTNPDPMIMLDYLKYFPIVMIVFIGTMFGWFWSISIGLQSKLPAELKMNTLRFKIFFFIPLVYIFLISLTLIAFFTKTLPNNLGFLGFLIFPLHLFSMFCMFHNLYFTAKTIKTVELQKEVSFSDFAGEFFMIWFYPIGIWIIQPKINQLIK